MYFRCDKPFFMKKIQMVDLKGQYEHLKDDISAAFKEILDTTAFINGPAVQGFQKQLEEYLGVRHVIPCANGTDALQIAMMGLGLQPGDEVITADFTFAATVEVIALLNLTPVLVDVDPETYNIDVAAIEQAITPKTKAIVPVHLFGQAAPMEEIMRIAHAHNLYVIEDNAQATGADYLYRDGKTKKTGTIGNVGATSFFPSKNLGCYGDGGALYTNDDDLAHTLKGIVNHGMYKRYYHDVVGVNSRLDSFQAAVLSAKLPHLNAYNEARRNAAKQYTKAFADNPHIKTPTVVARHPNTHVFHQYVIEIRNGQRDALTRHLKEKGIPFGIYYPVPLHLQKAYRDNRYKEADFEVTNRITKEVLALPMHTELEKDQIDFIADTINTLVRK